MKLFTHCAFALALIIVGVVAVQAAHFNAEKKHSDDENGSGINSSDYKHTLEIPHYAKEYPKEYCLVFDQNEKNYTVLLDKARPQVLALYDKLEYFMIDGGIFEKKECLYDHAGHQNEFGYRLIWTICQSDCLKSDDTCDPNDTSPVHASQYRCNVILFSSEFYYNPNECVFVEPLIGSK